MEGLLLGLAGGVLGMALAPHVAALLIRTIWGEGRRQIEFSSHPDLRILAFNFGLAIFVSLLFSVAPALQFRRPDVTQALKQQAAIIAGGSLHLRRAMVAAQIALSVVLAEPAGRPRTAPPVPVPCVESGRGPR